MAPKLTSCDVFGMLLTYWLSTKIGFIGGERVNPVGVLVNGGLPWCLQLWFGLCLGFQACHHSAF